MLTAFLAALAALSASAQAQWTVVNLHPAGATRSYAVGVSGGQQVGRVDFGTTTTYPSAWNGSAASWVNLLPAGAAPSPYLGAFGVGGGQQVGICVVGGLQRASLWSGTAASWVDLSPSGTTESQGYGAGDGYQVGTTIVGIVRHASLWSGTAASWVDLSPEGTGGSDAYGVGGGQQVGFVQVSSGETHAALWTGTAASWVDLNPEGWTSSTAWNVDGGQQVGRVGSGVSHASLWNGTAASWVDLSPAGSSNSIASGVSGGWQVGVARVGGIERASLWRGTAASWVDLGAFLPQGFTSSVAIGIWTDAIFIYISGAGYNSVTGHEEALLWVHAAPGACCQGGTCSLVSQNTGCASGQFQGPGTSCGVAGNPTMCCRANFDGVNGLQVADIFAFLGAWFADDSRADFTGDGHLSVSDIFYFLNEWFAGC